MGFTMGPKISLKTIAAQLASLALIAFVAIASISPNICSSAQAQSHPTPDAAAGDWELAIKYEAPRVVVIDGQWYWAMPYTVTNNSRLTVNFWPACMAQGDNGQIVEGPKVISNEVFNAVAKAIGPKDLLSPTKVAGPIRQGEDFARRSFFIWKNFKIDVDSFSVFIQGLSGESQSFTHPETKEVIRVYRNLMVTFAAPGNPKQPTNVRVTETGRTTVMR